MTIRSQSAIEALLPGGWQDGTNRGPQGVGPVTFSTLEDIVDTLFALNSRSVSGGQSSDGASQTIAVYEIDLTAYVGVVGDVADHIAALSDQDLVDPLEIKSYQLDGTQAVVLTADGQTYDVAICVIQVSGALELHAVFGDEAADGAEVAPTGAQCQTAIVAAGITGHNAAAGGLIIGRIKIQRVAVDTITMTHTDITTDASLSEERLVGTLR